MTNPNDGKAMSPKANEGKALTVEEAVERAKWWHARYTDKLAELGGEPLREDIAALATLEALAEENAKLKTALKELAENIHPEAAYISRVEEYTKLECQFYALQAENAALKAEVERLDSAYKWLSQTNTELVEMRETAAAECEKWKAWYEERKDVAEGTRQMFNDKVAELEKVWAERNESTEEANRFHAALARVEEENERLKEDLNRWQLAAGRLTHGLTKAEAELARYRRFDPLIEAAEGVEWVDASGRLQTTDDQAILRAALKCREQAIPERDK